MFAFENACLHEQTGKQDKALAEFSTLDVVVLAYAMKVHSLHK
jgi:hypothetical protein